MFLRTWNNGKKIYSSFVDLFLSICRESLKVCYNQKEGEVIIFIFQIEIFRIKRFR